MALGLLSGAASLFGFLKGTSELGGITAAGTALQNHNLGTLRDGILQNTEIGKVLNTASKAGVLSNASAGKYTIQQNAQAVWYDTQNRIANKWMQVLGGIQ